MTARHHQPRFERLLHEHRKIVFKVAGVYARGADRDDLAQEIAAQLWRSFESYDEARAKFSTWMYRISLNVAISHTRRERGDPVARSEPLEAWHLDTIGGDGPPAEPDPRIGKMMAFIGQLEPLNRALVLLYLEERSYAEIAEVLGISETNVATKIGRIKQKLARADGVNGRKPDEGMSMELDEMKMAWQELDQRLQRNEALQSDLRRELSLDKTRSTLRTWLWLPGFELAISVWVAWLAGSFLGDNQAQLLTAAVGALPALILLVLATLGAAASLSQIVAVASIDYAAPVLSIQRRLASARSLRIRLTQVGLLLWLPLWPVCAVFVMQRGLGLDIYRQLGLAWLIANVGFGLLLALLLVWLARRYGERLAHWRPLRRLADSIAGGGLVAATAQLDEISRFDRE